MKKVPKKKCVDVKTLRSRLCETQAEFAARLGVSVVTVARWEAGTNSPRGLALRALRQIENIPTTS